LLTILLATNAALTPFSAPRSNPKTTCGELVYYYCGVTDMRLCAYNPASGVLSNSTFIAGGSIDSTSCVLFCLAPNRLVGTCGNGTFFYNGSAVVSTYILSSLNSAYEYTIFNNVEVIIATFQNISRLGWDSPAPEKLAPQLTSIMKLFQFVQLQR